MLYGILFRAYGREKVTMCEYCKGNVWDRETIESDNLMEYIVGDKKLLIASWTPAYDGHNAECNWEAEFEINYCPMCGKKLGD